MDRWMTRGTWEELIVIATEIEIMYIIVYIYIYTVYTVYKYIYSIQIYIQYIYCIYTVYTQYMPSIYIYIYDLSDSNGNTI